MTASPSRRAMSTATKLENVLVRVLARAAALITTL